MTPCMSPYYGDGGSNNEFADRKIVNYTIVHTKLEVGSFKRKLLALAVSVTPKDRVPE